MASYLTGLSLTFLLLLTRAQDPLDPCPDPPYNNNLAKIIVDGIEAFRPFMSEGMPSLGIPPLDPLGPIPPISFSVHNEYINLDGTVNDTIIYNLSQFITCEVTIDIGLRPKFFIDLRMENYHMDGFYDMDGVYVAIFPIFGSGNYVLDVYNSSVSGGGKISYNVITDHAQVHDLALDIRFEELSLFMECLLGCGDMADFINEFLSDIATAIFNAVWDFANPILNQAIENGVNQILKDIKVSEVLTPGTSSPLEDISEVEDGKIKIKFPMSEFLKPLK